MSLYTENSILGAQKKHTTFRAEGGYISFYTEADYTLNRVRSAMTSLGIGLFVNGITIQEQIQEHPAVQSFGSDYENLTAFSMVKSTLQVNGLYVQEGADPAWMAPGHPRLVAYVDFFSTGSLLQAHDTTNSNNELEQTIVVRNLRISSKSVVASDASGVTYQLSFNGGRVTRLATTTMDLP